MPSDYSKFDRFIVNFPSEFIIHIQINQPKKINAYDTETWTQYRDIFNTVKYDADVRCVIYSGVGKHFTSGLDVKQAMEDLGSGDINERSRLKLRNHIRDFQNAIHTPFTISKPVIGVAHGISYGLALDILTAHDIRIASRDARLSIKEVDIGLTSDIGTLQRIVKISGNISWVKQIALTARIFDADEAFQNGLISQVEDTKEKAIESALNIAKIIVSKSPVAVQGTKESINYALDHTINDGLEQIANFNSSAIQEDTKISIMAVLSKEKPIFSKL